MCSWRVCERRRIKYKTAERVTEKRSLQLHVHIWTKMKIEVGRCWIEQSLRKCSTKWTQKWSLQLIWWKMNLTDTFFFAEQWKVDQLPFSVWTKQLPSSYIKHRIRTWRAPSNLTLSRRSTVYLANDERVLAFFTWQNVVIIWQCWHQNLTESKSTHHVEVTIVLHYSNTTIYKFKFCYTL